MKKNWKIFTVFTVLVFAIAFAGITAVFAQGPGQPAVPDGTGNQGQVAPGMGYRAVDEADMHAAVAAALGISVEELEAELAAGNTVYLLAQELVIDFDEVQAAMTAVHDAAMQEAVDNGVVTPYQANQYQQNRSGQQAQGTPANVNAGTGSAYGTGPAAGTGTAYGTGPAAGTGSAFGTGPAAGAGQVNRGANNGDCIYPTP
jgi:hypothetical protein